MARQSRRNAHSALQEVAPNHVGHNAVRRTGKRRNRDLENDIMTGQSNAQRSRIRKSQRQLHREILHSRNDIADVQKTAFDDFSDRNNQIFEQVNYVREASHDLDNCVAISEIAIEQASRQGGAAFRLSADKLVDKLRHMALNEAGTFDWGRLGVEVGVCSHGIAPVDCLLGPLVREKAKKKERQRAERRQRYQGEATQPESIDKKIGAETEQTEKTTRRVKKMKNKMDSLSMEERRQLGYSDKPDSHGVVHAPNLDLFSLVINPKSFTQTVENFMDFSFLIKGGNASLGINGGLPVTQVSKPRTVEVNREGSSNRNSNKGDTQLVIPISKDFLQDILVMRENKGVCQVGHRQEGEGTDYVDVLNQQEAL